MTGHGNHPDDSPDRANRPERKVAPPHWYGAASDIALMGEHGLALDQPTAEENYDSHIDAWRARGYPQWSWQRGD